MSEQSSNFLRKNIFLSKKTYVIIIRNNYPKKIIRNNYIKKGKNPKIYHFNNFLRN